MPTPNPAPYEKLKPHLDAARNGYNTVMDATLRRLPGWHDTPRVRYVAVLGLAAIGMVLFAWANSGPSKGALMSERDRLQAQVLALVQSKNEAQTSLDATTADARKAQAALKAETIELTGKRDAARTEATAAGDALKRTKEELAFTQGQLVSKQQDLTRIGQIDAETAKAKATIDKIDAQLRVLMPTIANGGVISNDWTGAKAPLVRHIYTTLGEACYEIKHLANNNIKNKVYSRKCVRLANLDGTYRANLTGATADTTQTGPMVFVFDKIEGNTLVVDTHLGLVINADVNESGEPLFVTPFSLLPEGTRNEYLAAVERAKTAPPAEAAKTCPPDRMQGGKCKS